MKNRNLLRWILDQGFRRAHNGSIYEWVDQYGYKWGTFELLHIYLYGFKPDPNAPKSTL